MRTIKVGLAAVGLLLAAGMGTPARAEQTTLLTERDYREFQQQFGALHRGGEFTACYGTACVRCPRLEVGASCVLLSRAHALELGKGFYELHAIAPQSPPPPVIIYAPPPPPIYFPPPPIYTNPGIDAGRGMLRGLYGNTGEGLHCITRMRPGYGDQQETTCD